MATVVVGCDTNNSNDSKVQNTIVKALEKQNHTVEKLTIGPGHYANYDWHKTSKSPKGKIGVYIIADGINSIGDAYDNPNGFKYNYFVVRGDLGRSKMDSRSDFEKNPIGADADCKRNCAKLKGKTFPEINKIVKSKCMVVFGTTANEMASELIKAMGGDPGSDSGSKSKSSSTIKSALQEALYGWNGEVECYLRDDTIHIHKVNDPTATKLRLVEGENILLESCSLTDINPNTINRLVVKWKNYKFEIKDDARIKRFGEIKKTITVSNKKKSGAIASAHREWQKLLKDSGRKFECKVDGDPKWRIGEWVRVYVPTFELNGYMYITKCSHDDDGDWECGLTLEDYPPDLGVKPSQKTDKNESSEDS